MMCRFEPFYGEKSLRRNVRGAPPLGKKRLGRDDIANKS